MGDNSNKFEGGYYPSEEERPEERQHLGSLGITGELRTGWSDKPISPRVDLGADTSTGISIHELRVLLNEEEPDII